MALVIADRVRETTTTTGTGAVTLAGAYTSFQSFLAAVGNGNSTYYTIASAVTGEWEVGIGTYTSASNTLSRTTVLASSNAGSLVNFSSGAKDVFVTQPAERSILVQSAGSGLFSGVAAFTANGVPYANSTSTLTTGSALTFDGNTFRVSAANLSYIGIINGTTRGVRFGADTTGSYIEGVDNTGIASYQPIIIGGSDLRFQVSGSEQMRLTSTGLGIGTSSPGAKLDVVGTSGTEQFRIGNTTGGTDFGITVTENGTAVINSAEGATGRGIQFQSGGTNTLLIDSSGNLGLGVTPSAWSTGSSIKAFQNPGGAFWNFSTNNVYVGQNYYWDGTNRVYINTAAATEYNQGSGQHRWYNAASGTAGDAITFTQAMTLDSSGRLFVGTTTLQSTFEVLTLAGSNSTANDITLYGPSTSQLRLQFSKSGAAGQGEVGYNMATDAMRFVTSGTERARIDSSGNLGLGVTPSASWVAGAAAFQQSIGSVHCNTSLGAYDVAYNSIRTASDSYVYAATGLNATRLQQRDGTFRFFTAASGTAGAAITFTQAMTLDASGNLGIGTTSPSEKLTVAGRIMSTVSGYTTNPTGAIFAYYNAGTPTTYVQAPASGRIEFWAPDTSAWATLSSGNLGLGVTPSAWQVGGNLDGSNQFTWSSYDASIGSNYYYNSGAKYKASGLAVSAYQPYGGAHKWFTAPSGTAGDAITFTQAMTLDASGNLAIGTTSPVAKLTVTSGTSGVQGAFGYGTGLNYITVGYSGNTSSYHTRFGYDVTAEYGYIQAYAAAGVADDIAINPSGGNLLVGTTSNSLFADTGGFIVYPTSIGETYIAIKHDSGTATGNSYATFVYGTGSIGSITQNGTTAVAYNTSSDYRLKDNQQPLTGSGAFIDALKPKTWNWKADGSRGVGFIAHEVQEVSPGSVVGEKDGEQMQAMEYGSAEFIANIIAELQSLRKRLADAGIA